MAGGARRSRWFARLRRFSLRFETRWTPLGRALLLALLFSGLFALNVRASLAYQLAALLLGAVVFARICGALVCVPRAGELVVTRRLPAAVTEHVPFRYTAEVRNTGRRQWRALEIEDGPVRERPTLSEARAQPDRHDAARPRFDQRMGYPRWLNFTQRREGLRAVRADVPTLAAHGASTVQLEATPTRRGVIRFDAAQVRATDPLGLVRRWRQVGGRSSLVALPTRYPVAWRSAWSSAPSAGSGSSRRQRKPGGDFATVREYRPGDALAHLSWRGLARYGVPVVKEFDEPVRPRWQVVLDCGLDDGDAAPDFDDLVRVAASFCEHLVTAGMPVGLLQVGGTVADPVAQASSVAELVALHTVLALAQPAADAGDGAQPAFAVPLDERDAVWVLRGFDDARQAAAAAKIRAGGNLLVLVVRPSGAAPLAAGPLSARPGCLVELADQGIAEALAGGDERLGHPSSDPASGAGTAPRPAEPVAR